MIFFVHQFYIGSLLLINLAIHTALQLTGNLLRYDIPILPINICPADINKLKNCLYILYDVNPLEGFNLRRDVYIRLAVFIRNYSRNNKNKGIKLVLPPFRRLYHWKSKNQQENLPWASFFNMTSLKEFAPVIDFEEFTEEIQLYMLDHVQVSVDFVYKLKHFDEMFENGTFHDKFQIDKCDRKDQRSEYLLHQPVLREKRFECIKFQGGANLLEKVIKLSLRNTSKTTNIFVFLNAEIVLHDHWGSRNFWMARRSMRFNNNLVNLAADFRLKKFNSTNQLDKVQRPIEWKKEKSYRGAIGGNYLCVHLRRGDFIYGREKTTPTLKSVAIQIKMMLNKLNLTSVFISSDCTQFEFEILQSYLKTVNVFRFSEGSQKQRSTIKDGDAAIIDQIICSHSRYFIGTFGSTFTYRIYEEREILGFAKKLTFNTLCDDLENCPKNSVWAIVY